MGLVFTVSVPGPLRDSLVMVLNTKGKLQQHWITKHGVLLPPAQQQITAYKHHAGNLALLSPKLQVPIRIVHFFPISQFQTS